MSRASIADMLAMYSKESEENEYVEDTGAGEGEASMAEDEMSAEIEEAVEEGIEVTEEGEAIEESTESLIDAADSMESSVEFLRTLRAKDARVTASVAHLWSKAVVTSMEARGIPAGIFEAELISFGDSFEANSYEDYSTEAEEKGEGIFRKIWNMIKAAFARLGQWITRMVGWFRTSGKSVKAAAEKLKKQAQEKQKGNYTTASRKVNIAPFSDIAVNGQLNVPDALTSLRNAVEVAMDTATAFANSAKKEAANFGKDPGFFTKMMGRFLGDLKTTSERFAGNQTIAKLPGDRTIEAFGADGKRFNFFGGEKFTFKLRVERAKNARRITGVGTPADLRTIVEIADGLIYLVDSTQSKFDKFNDTFGDLKLEAVPKGAKGDTKTADARKAAQLLQSTMLAAQRIPSALAPIIFPIAKRAYLYGKVCLNQYSVAK